MTDADVKLKAMFGSDVPPAMDAWFRLAVFERMEKRQAALKLALVVGVGVAATVAVALVGPQLSRDLSSNTLMIAGVAIAAGATLWSFMQLKRPI